MSAPGGTRRRRTWLWFVFYTVALFAIIGVSVARHEWSIAVTTILITVVFVWFTRRLFRRR